MRDTLGAFTSQKKKGKGKSSAPKAPAPTEEAGKTEETVEIDEPLWTMTNDELEAIGKQLGIERGKSKRNVWYNKLKKAWDAL